MKERKEGFVAKDDINIHVTISLLNTVKYFLASSLASISSALTLCFLLREALPHLLHHS